MKTLSKLEQNAAALKRWRTRLKRAMTAIDKLEKQRKRLEAKAQADLAVTTGKRPAVRVSVPAHPTVDSETTLGTVPPAPAPTVEIDTSIPAFLQRKKPGDPIGEQIAAEQAETKRLKARGRIAKMKAKQSGETRKMPLTGKAALAAIRG
jgi:hypothetical protein